MEPRAGPDPRADLEARIDAGEFDAFLAFRGTADGPEREERARQGFMLSAYAARVVCNPSDDLAGFLDELWAQARSLFGVGGTETHECVDHRGWE